MPKLNRVDEKTKMVEFVVEALGRHEKEVDRIVGELQVAKDKVSISTKKLNSKVEHISQKTDNLLNQIEQLKKLTLQ